MKKVYIEWWVGMVLLSCAVVGHILGASDAEVMFMATNSCILIGIDSIKQFIIDNKGETK
jgi:hypothetical protein